MTGAESAALTEKSFAKDIHAKLFFCNYFLFFGALRSAFTSSKDFLIRRERFWSCFLSAVRVNRRCFSFIQYPLFCYNMMPAGKWCIVCSPISFYVHMIQKIISSMHKNALLILVNIFNLCRKESSCVSDSPWWRIWLRIQS